MTASPAVETGRFTCGHNEYELSITPNSDNVSAPRAVANFFATFFLRWKKVDYTNSKSKLNQSKQERSTFFNNARRNLLPHCFFFIAVLI